MEVTVTKGELTYYSDLVSVIASMKRGDWDSTFKYNLQVKNEEMFLNIAQVLSKICHGILAHERPQFILYKDCPLCFIAGKIHKRAKNSSSSSIFHIKLEYAKGVFLAF